MDFDTFHFIVCALNLSRLEYGNGLLSSSQSDIHKLQRIQNSATKLICKATNATRHLHMYVNCTGCLLRIESPFRSWFSCLSAPERNAS